jgi:outer membrane lipoprotein-sorting protein
MRRRISLITALALLVTFVLAGCGSKNADSIVKDLDKVVSKMESYQGSGTMILHTGQQPLEYKVEVWYQKPQLYRISLTNAKRDITQIVLRNEEGVFVLTPQLHKSYRFQSDWPENQGQVYLYQTLIQSILMDNSRLLTKDKDNYVFDVMAGNYQNGSFARQKIWLKQDNYAPSRVEVSDTNATVMVEVNFDGFEFGKKFDKSAFDMDKNMGIVPNSKPSDSNDGAASPDATNSPDNQTTVTPENQSTESPNDQTSVTPENQSTEGPDQGVVTNEGQGGNGEPVAAAPEDKLTVIEPDPDALPVGVELQDQIDVQLGDHMGYMLRYSGTYDFTLVETTSKDIEETLSVGITKDLGFTLGHLTEGESSTLTWTYDGVEYRISSADLPQDDMVRIAQSMVDSSGK